MPSTAPIPADNLDFAWDRPETAATLRVKLAATFRISFNELPAKLAPNVRR
jgi:hypothetical protein